MRKTYLSLVSIIVMAAMLIIGLFSASLFTKNTISVIEHSGASAGMKLLRHAEPHGEPLMDHSIRRANLAVGASPYMDKPANDEAEPIPITEFARLEQELQQIIMVETDDDYITKAYQSLHDVRDRLLRIMSPELAEGCIEVYFRETDEGGVILVPTQAPLWFDFNDAYEVKKVSNTRYEVSQEHQSALFGHVQFTITYTYTDGGWIMVDRFSELLT